MKNEIRFGDRPGAGRAAGEPPPRSPAADPARVQVDCRLLAPLQIFRQWVADGLTCATDIAAEMGLTKGTGSKLARKAEREGWLVKEGRDYRLVAP